jgi:hypothetical protein
MEEQAKRGIEHSAFFSAVLVQKSFHLYRSKIVIFRQLTWLAATEPRATSGKSAACCQLT